MFFSLWFRSVPNFLLNKQAYLLQSSLSISKPSPYHILPVLSLTKSTKQVKEAHAVAIVSGFIRFDSPVCASLILNYASHGLISIAHQMFEKIPHRNQTAFLWNTFIRAYSNLGSYKIAFEVFRGMLAEGVKPDDHTFPFVLKACTDVSNLELGKEIHGLIVKLGFDHGIYVGNTLLSFYGFSMYLSDSFLVFISMIEKDIITWNSMIAVFSVNRCFHEALDCFLTMDFRHNDVSIISVLPVCGALGYLPTTKVIHGYALKAGMDSNVTICNAIIDTYGKCGDIKSCKKVFDEMIDKNVVSWNTIISSFAHLGYGRDALDIFRSMVETKRMPNSTTISSFLPVLVELELLELGKVIHAYSIRTGAILDIFVANSLIDMYAKSGFWKEGSTIFNQIESKNVVSWNAMIANLAQNGFQFEALNLVHDMQANGHCPNSITLTNMLPACARLASLKQGKEIHGRSVRTGSFSDLFVSNALIDMYVKCGCPNLGRKVFQISMRDEVSYNTLIVGYSQSEKGLESINLFNEMGLIGLKHDTVSFVGVLSACANLTLIKQGKEIHGFLVRKQFHSHLFLANSLLDMYTKCGKLSIAQKVFDRITNKDVASWNTMILSYGMQGEVDAAINLFERMKQENVEGDHVSYVAVLSACSHGGLVEMGKMYFDQMCSRKITPGQMHYACMVDLFGRAGLMEEAISLIRDLPVEPDYNVWGALLGACRVHGNVELGRSAAEQLLRLKPDHCGYYILLSNLYAEAGMWTEANKVRELMRSRGVRKNPGYSWVETNNVMNTFVAGDRLEVPKAMFSLG